MEPNWNADPSTHWIVTLAGRFETQVSRSSKRGGVERSESTTSLHTRGIHSAALAYVHAEQRFAFYPGVPKFFGIQERGWTERARRQNGNFFAAGGRSQGKQRKSHSAVASANSASNDNPCSGVNRLTSICRNRSSTGCGAGANKAS